jgi:hypothetical protein
MLHSNRKSILDRATADLRQDIVAIDDEKIAATPWPPEAAEPMRVTIEGPPGATPMAALSFLVAMGSINYRFWTLTEHGTLARYRYLRNSGARALWAAFERAWGQSAAAFAARLRSQPFEMLFGDIPDKESRIEILTEILKEDRLNEVCTEIHHHIRSRGSVLVMHAELLAKAFPVAFGDPYLKKAQLALSAYAGYLRSAGKEIDVSDLTAFADYQVPRVLRALGILKYSSALRVKVDTALYLQRESIEERAIRSATVLACEKIASHIGGTAADVDHLLWQSQDVAGDARFHLTQTTWY